jgi:hypothetical protein
MTKSEAELIEAAKAILESDSPMTIRQLFYRLLSLPSNAPGHIPNTNRSYSKFVGLMTKARLENNCCIEWGRIVEANEGNAGGRIVDANLGERNET